MYELTFFKDAAHGWLVRASDVWTGPCGMLEGERAEDHFREAGLTRAGR